jgi:hypothetical protein
MSIARGALYTVMCLLASLATGASGQEKKAWPPKEIKSTGKAWGVYMKPAKLEAIPDKGVLVAEADSEEEARKLADKFFNDPNNKFPRDLFSALKKNGGNESVEQPTFTLEMPGGKKLVVPLSNVDPKPLPKAKPPIIDLTGKQAKGKIGKHDVTFEFQKGNKLLITGDVKGEGEWGLTEERLIMTTKPSVFFGTVDKDGKMKGQRVNRDGKELLDWGASLSSTAGDELVGTTWRVKVKNTKMNIAGTPSWTMKLSADGKGVEVGSDGMEHPLKWSRDGKVLTVVAEYAKESVTRVLTIDGNTMSGPYRGNFILVVSKE